MPSVSIDTFFACTLLVSVAIVATAFLAGTMQTQIGNMQDLNQQDYLRTIADHFASSCGVPADWGANGEVPTSFGLSAANVSGQLTIDVDKVSRLSSQNIWALSYPQMFQAAHLNNIALGVSVSQMLSVEISSLGSRLEGDLTVYSFWVTVAQDAGSIGSNLSCYAVANGFLTHISGSTAVSGGGGVSVEIPNSASGPAMLVVFARAPFDERLTSFGVYRFGHLSAEPSPNLTHFSLSPLNNTLQADPKGGETAGNVYTLSYSCSSNLTATANGTYSVPVFVDQSPIVLAVQGDAYGSALLEWTAYPQVPFTAGADFSKSETNVFVYPVTINGALYKLTLRFGDIVK